MIAPFVRYKGKCWENDGLEDREGRVMLIDLHDSSKGVLAPIKDIYPCREDEMEAIKYFRQKRFEESQDPILKALEANLRRFLGSFRYYADTDEAFVVESGKSICIGYNTNRRDLVGHFDLQIDSIEKGPLVCRAATNLRTRCYILHFEIREDMKGRKIGRELVGCMESFIRDCGCQEIETTPSGEGTGFWPKMGYEQKGLIAVKPVV